MNWQDYFRNIAQQVKLKSKDWHTQIGVVIVGKDNEIVSTGYNSFPRGIDDSRPERQERPEKYFFMCHAEQNAIYNAARIGVSTKGCTMYMTCGMPCADCTKAIINAGIEKIVIEQNGMGSGANDGIWTEHGLRSITMFIEAGMDIEYYGDNS
jgi:dCMP deaminase